LIKDYDVGIDYHLANVVADALIRKRYYNATLHRRMHLELQREIEYLNLGLINDVAVAMEGANLRERNQKRSIRGHKVEGDMTTYQREQDHQFLRGRSRYLVVR
jgi:hypothetical protein